MTLWGCADFCVGGELDAFPASGWRDEPAPAVVRREYAVVTGEVDPRLRHQCRQSRYKIHGRMAAPIKCHLRRSIAVGRLLAGDECRQDGHCGSTSHAATSGHRSAAWYFFIDSVN